MKTHQLSLTAVAAALVLTSIPANADGNRMTLPERRTERDFRSSYTVNDPQQENRGFFSRIFGWPGRATRTVLHSPSAIGESLSGHRDDHRSYVHRERMRDGRTVFVDGTGRALRGTERVIGNVADSGQSFVVRSGRTIVHSPEIIGESLTGDRTIVRDGHFFARTERHNDMAAGAYDGIHNTRAQNLFAGTW